MYLYGQLTQRTDMKKPRNYRKEYVRTQGTAKGKLDRAARNKARTSPDDSTAERSCSTP